MSRGPVSAALPAVLAGLLVALVTVAAGAGCSPRARAVVGLALSAAYRPPAPAATRLTFPGTSAVPAAAPPRYELLAGDLHCHVRPPDAADVTRDVAGTVALARAEGLDFVVLTPHVAARFFLDPAARAAVLRDREALRAELARQGDGRTTYVLGMEYTDGTYGHVGASFADLAQVFADVPVAEARRHPERFFERFAARGGLLVVNHPLVTPLDSFVPVARVDVSWRPWTSTVPVPPEIRAVDGLAQGYEAFNLAVTELRDRYLLGERDHSLAATLARLDRQIVAQQRRISPVGGTDSHGMYLRPTTFVWSAGRSEAAIHDALLGGRMCVRSPEACTLEARAAAEPRAPSDGGWVGVGGALHGVRAIEVRAEGDDVDVFLDGVAAASPEGGRAATIAVDPGRCSVLRARVGEGYSAPIYVNCAFP